MSNGMLNTHLFSMLFTDDKFQQLQQTFLDTHYVAFEDAEENKLIYTEIHKEYVIILNKFIFNQ